MKKTINNNRIYQSLICKGFALMSAILFSIKIKNNLSTDSYKGVISLIKEEVKKQKKLKTKLIQLVKLSAFSSSFTRASSNSIYLLGQMNEYLGESELYNIKLSDTDLSGLSLYNCYLQRSVFRNVCINSCNFNQVDLSNAYWTDIKCNELHSIINKDKYFKKIVFSQSGQLAVACTNLIIYMCNIKEGTKIVLFDNSELKFEDHFKELSRQQDYSIADMIFSPDESYLAVPWYQRADGGFYVIQICNVEQRSFIFLKVQPKYFPDLKFSPNSQTLAFSNYENIEIWSVKGVQITVLEKHTGFVRGVEFKSDESILGSYGNDETIRIWKLEDFSFKILKNHTKAVTQIAFQPGGELLASCSSDSTVQLWNINTYENICKFEGHSGGVWALFFASDGLTLASLGFDQKTIVWDVKDKKQLRCMQGSEYNFKYYTCSSNGRFLAQQQENQIQIWDLTIGKVVRVFEGQSKALSCMAFQPGAQVLASISDDEYNIQLWDVQTEKNQHQFHGHKLQVLQLAFSPDGTKLASLGIDATLHIWNVRDGKQIARIDQMKTDNIKISFSEDGQYILIEIEENCMIQYKCWYFKDDQFINLPEQKQLYLMTKIISQPGIDTFAWGVEKDSISSICLWNIKEKKLKKLQSNQKVIKSLWFTSDGLQLITYFRDKFVLIWDMQSYTVIKQFTDVIKIINSNNNDIFGFLNIYERKVNIYNVKEKKELGEIYADFQQKYLLVISNFKLAQIIGNKINLWDINNGRQTNILQGHTKSVEGIVFSLSNENLVSFSKDVIKVWNMNDSSEYLSLKGHVSDLIGISLSPNGEILASYCEDMIVILWGMKQFQEMSTLKGHQKELLFIVFSPDSNTLVTADKDSKTVLWNVQNGNKIQQFENCAPWGQLKQGSMAFSPNSTYFICYSTLERGHLIWNIIQNQQYRFIAGDPAENIIFSFDSQTFAIDSYTSERQSLIALQNINQEEIFDLIHKGNTKLDCQIIYQGKIKAIYGNDENIVIYDQQTGKHIKSLIGHKHIVSKICFSPDGLYLVSCSWDQTIRIWDITVWKQVALIKGHKNFIDFIVFSPDGLTLASASRDKTIRLWDIRTFKQIRVIQGIKEIDKVQNLVFSSSGSKIAWFNDKQETVQVLSLEGKEETLILNGDGQITTIFDLQENMLISCDARSAKVWDLKKNQCIKAFDIYTKEQTQTYYALSVNKIVVVAKEKDQKQFIIYDYKADIIIQTQQEHTNCINQIVFSPDHKVLASCGDDGMIKLWDFTQEIPLVYKTLATYQPLTAAQCKITEAQITSKTGWNLKQLFIQKGALE